MTKHLSLPARLRRFALTVAAGATIVAGISWWRGHTVVPSLLWSVAAIVALAGVTVPTSLAPVERGWLAVGRVLAWLNTRIILTALFYLVVTPIAIIMRPFRDPLDRRFDAKASTYWCRRTTGVSRNSYERQF